MLQQLCATADRGVLGELEATWLLHTPARCSWLGTPAHACEHAPAAALPQGSSRKGLVEGDVIWWRCCGGDAGGGEQQGGALQYGRIAGFHFGQGRARHEDSWHVQLLSPALSLPSGLYRIHGEPPHAASGRCPLPALASAACGLRTHPRAGVSVPIR